jgi:hypothetical protein
MMVAVLGVSSSQYDGMTLRSSACEEEDVHNARSLHEALFFESSIGDCCHCYLLSTSMHTCLFVSAATCYEYQHIVRSPAGASTLLSLTLFAPSHVYQQLRVLGSRVLAIGWHTVGRLSGLISPL